MLEAPECHKVVSFLKKYMIGSSIVGLDIVDGPYCNKYPQGYTEVCNILTKNSLCVKNIIYRGNMILITTQYESDTKGLVTIYIIHYICHDSTWSLQPQDDSKWHIKLDNSHTCWFNSENDSSTIRFTKSIKVVECQQARFGVDILSPNFTHATLKKLVNNHSNMNICLFLTTSSIVAGCQSMMKSQVLYNANISPLRKLETLTDSEIEKLYTSIRVVGGLLANDILLDNQEKNMDVYSDPKVKKIKTPDNDITYWNPHNQV